MRKFFLTIAFLSTISLLMYTEKVHSIESASKILQNELNKCFGMNETEPIYLITVTRSIDATGVGTGMLHHNDWAYIRNALLDICSDNGTITHLQSRNHNERNVCTYLHTDPLKNRCKIVTFNESFFQKKPLANTDYANFLNGGGAITSGILALSQQCHNTIFYPNLPHLSPYAAPADVNILAKYDDERVNRQGFINYSMGVLPDQKPTPGGIVRNITYGINKGQILTEYKKRSYFREDDHEVNHNKFIYDFGDGRDKSVYKHNDKDLKNLRDVLLKHVKTEICLDLVTGVRRSNGWKNFYNDKTTGLLILQSHWIDPMGIIAPTQSINNLPRSSKDDTIKILHADPKSHELGTNLFNIDERGGMITFQKEVELLHTGQDGARMTISIYKLN
ncbi:MAG: hypothetical protein LBF57_01020 [Holosporaceae bacterium]|jgi:hypothetical protein|nr:hypothetical protein [Holosporaceae bacterium]